MSTIYLPSGPIEIGSGSFQSIVRDPSIDSLDLRDVSVRPPCGRVRQLYGCAHRTGCEVEADKILDLLDGPRARLSRGQMSREFFQETIWLYSENRIALARVSECETQEWTGTLNDTIASRFWELVGTGKFEADLRWLSTSATLAVRTPRRIWVVIDAGGVAASELSRMFRTWLTAPFDGTADVVELQRIR